MSLRMNMSLRGVAEAIQRKQWDCFVVALLAMTAIFLVTPLNLFACPSGQSCPAGKDCVADSSQCVADTSSSSSGSSTAPTTTKDQLGLTLDPEPYLQFGESRGPIDMGGWALKIESEYEFPESEIGLEVDMSMRYHVNPQTSVGASSSVLFSSDVTNSDIPSETGWVWDLGADAKF